MYFKDTNLSSFVFMFDELSNGGFLMVETLKVRGLPNPPRRILFDSLLC